MEEDMEENGATTASPGITRGDLMRRSGVLAAGGLLTGAGGSSLLSPSVTAAQAATGAGKKRFAGVTITYFAGGNPGDAFGSILLRGATAAAADLGISLTPVFSGWDPETIITQFRSAIARAPDGIVMLGHPGAAAVAPLAKKAAAAGIVVDYQNVDVPTVRAAYGGGYVGADLPAQGVALAKKALSTLPIKRGMKAIVYGAYIAAEPREAQTANTLEKAGLHVTRIVIQPSWASDPSLLTPTLTAEMLKNPDTKLVVYGGGQFLGAVPQYMASLHKSPGQVVNIGFDLSPQVIAAFKQGYVQLTADQEPFMQGYLSVESVAFSKRYGMAALNVDTGAAFVTKANYKRIEALVSKGLR
jgi:simple sugar transport system substrate-binding protein